MNIKQLEYLVKVMECGNITQAAQQMSVSQPSLTKAIASLEEEYGITIITRRSRGVEFTPEGLDFLLYAKGVLAAVNAYPKAMSKPLIKARLFVACQQLDFMNPLVIDTYHKHCEGNVFFNIVEANRSDVVKHVLQGNVDLGLAVRTTMDMKDLIWDKEAHRLDIQVIDRDKAYVAVGPLSPFWNRSSVRMKELSESLHILLDMEEEAKQGFWFDQGQYINLNNNRIVYVNTASACENFLLNTDSISFCSGWTRGCYSNPDIRVIPLEGEDTFEELILIRRKGEALVSTEADFVASVYEKLNKEVPEDIRRYQTKMSKQ